MRWLFRWLFRLLILSIVLVVAAILLLDTIVREITERRIEQTTGLDVKIGRMRVGIFEPRMTIENFVLYNSAEFGGSPLLDVPELHVECDRSPLLHANYHFTLVRLNLARLNVVEDKNGRKNLEVLDKHLKKSGNGPIESDVVQPNTAGKGRFRQIDTLNLSLGRATYINMKNPGKVDELPFEVRNQIYTNINSAAQVQNILLAIMVNRHNLLGGDGQYWLDVLGLQKKVPTVKSSP
jgi:uncharacterized protein involved in outer membrane biogenesis